MNDLKRFIYSYQCMWKKINSQWKTLWALPKFQINEDFIIHFSALAMIGKS